MAWVMSQHTPGSSEGVRQACKYLGEVWSVGIKGESSEQMLWVRNLSNLFQRKLGKACGCSRMNEAKVMVSGTAVGRSGRPKQGLGLCL